MDLYHVASLSPTRYLFLNKIETTTFQWFEVSHATNQQKPTSITSNSPAEAIRAAYKKWDHSFFRLLHCGFCYTLPERDEVGCNAFFWQMAKSYANSNGRYFDEERGHLCYVDFASQEALALWRKLR